MNDTGPGMCEFITQAFGFKSVLFLQFFPIYKMDCEMDFDFDALSPRGAPETFAPKMAATANVQPAKPGRGRPKGAAASTRVKTAKFNASTSVDRFLDVALHTDELQRLQHELATHSAGGVGDTARRRWQLSGRNCTRALRSGCSPTAAGLPYLYP